MAVVSNEKLTKRNLLIVAETLRRLKRVSLSSAAKAANAWVVTAQIKDAAGNNVSAATLVEITTHAPTTAKGVITTTTGAQKTNEAVTGFTHTAVVLSDATGKVVVSVADDQAEKVEVIAHAAGCISDVLETP